MIKEYRDKKLNRKTKRNRVGKLIIMSVLMINMFTINVFATTTANLPSEILNPINMLKVLMIGIVSAVGFFIIFKNVISFAHAWQERDTNTMWNSVIGFAGGLMVAFIGAVLGFLGL